MKQTRAVSLPSLTKKEMDRRSFLRGSSAFAGLAVAGLSGCAKQVKTATPSAPALPFYDAPGNIIPIRADEDRIFRVTVCLRPFRAAGPRLEVERVGEKAVIHNYGHGGSGWSLSWGYAQRVAQMAREAGQGDNEVAVVGAGALGLTSAIMLQRAGKKVTIYAKELSPYTRSSRATGSWTPDSRLAFKSAAPANFPQEWEAMARASFFMYQSYLGTPGSPVEWTDRYGLHDVDPHSASQQEERGESHDWLHLYDRIQDLTPHGHLMPPGTTPFPTTEVYRSSSLTFNVADFSRQLMNDFYIAGGRYEYRDFQSAQEIVAVPQKVIVNCTGYAAKALWKDETITPVRGQISWMIPQEGVNYGLGYHGLNVLARRDGIVLQLGGAEDEGWGETDETVHADETKRAVSILQELYNRMEQKRRKA